MSTVSDIPVQAECSCHLGLNKCPADLSPRNINIESRLSARMPPSLGVKGGGDERRREEIERWKPGRPSRPRNKF